MHCSPAALIALILILGVPGSIVGQTSQRSAIEGVVRDAQGAVIANSMVTLESDRLLGGVRTTSTNESGHYRFSELLPGAYDVAASATGFRRTIRAAVPLPVDTTYTIDLTLTVSGVSETVVVEAGAALLDGRTAATPTVFDDPALHDIPNERTLRSVLSLAPGVTTTTPLFGYVGEVAYGGTQGSNGFTVDGVNLTESTLGDQWSDVHYNWLEEVQVVGLGAPAEYGATTGAIVNGVLRSGSNRTSGMAELLTIQPGWTGSNLGSYPAELDRPVPPKTIQSWWDANGQIGTPLIRDRLWLFAGGSYLDHEYRQYGFEGPDSTKDTRRRAIVKVDAAPFTRMLWQAFVTTDAADTVGADLHQYSPTLDSSPDLTSRTSIWNARATAILSGDTVLELRTSGNTGRSLYEPHAPATLAGPSPQIDRLTGIECCNSFWRRERRSSVLVAATLVHDRDHLWGRHTLKLGIDFEHSPAESEARVPTNQSLDTIDGVVVGVHEWAGDHMQLTARRGTFYVQDRWVMNDRLTLEPGMRVEFNVGSVPGVDGSYRTVPLAPRIGFAWDLRGTQTTLLRAHYGRYHDPLYGNVYWYTQPDAHSPHIIYAVVDGQLLEQFRFIEEYALPKPSDLKQSHVDQWVAGIEQALGGQTTIQARYIGRRFGNFIGWTDERIDDWTALEVRDPGPDGTPDTADDGGLVTVHQVYGDGVDISDRALVLGNPDGAYRRYDALQLIATRRFAANWQYEVSYTWSRSRGTAGNEYDTNATFHSMNPFGYGADPGKNTAPPSPPTYDYSEFKAFGSYRAPWLGGFTTAAALRWHSGTRWTRIARVFSPVFVSFPAEPVGSRRTPSLGALDVRVEKTLQFPRGGTLGLYVDLLNATNVGRATAYDPNSGPTFGRVRGWTDPRTGRLGLRYNF